MVLYAGDGRVRARKVGVITYEYVYCRLRSRLQHRISSPFAWRVDFAFYIARGIFIRFYSRPEDFLIQIHPAIK